MKVNKTYRSLLDKSISSMLSAIEIYNKPNFAYREEAFSILMVNAWELIFKAYLLKINKYNIHSVYEMEVIKKKDGTPSTRKKPSTNRCGNPKSISIFKAITALETQGKISSNLIESINSLIELRDNAIHFINPKEITKQVQELGFASIKNYISIIKTVNLEIDLSDYNFYLMPLAYVDAKIEAESILTCEVKNYLNMIKSKIENQNSLDDNFDIAISIDIDFKKGSSFDSIGFTYDSDGIPISLTEENIKKRFPLTHVKLIENCKKRYSNFKQDKDFQKIMKEIKKNEKLFHSRKLDPDNKKSQSKPFYSSNVFQELDKRYLKF